MKIIQALRFYYHCGLIVILTVFVIFWKYLDFLQINPIIIIGRQYKTNGLEISLKNTILHVVAETDLNTLWMITAYYPDKNKWSSDFKTRKES